MRVTALVSTLAFAFAQTPPTDPCKQDQIRLSLTKATDGSKMTVSWATSNATTPQDCSCTFPPLLPRLAVQCYTHTL